MKTKKLNKITI